MMESRSRGVLDRPVKPGDDNLLWSSAVCKSGISREPHCTVGCNASHPAALFLLAVSNLSLNSASSSAAISLTAQ
jgi:hypothetical protein